MSLTSEVIVLLHAMPHHHQRDSATARRSTDRTSSEEEHNTVTTPIRTLSIRTVLLADAGITGVTGLLMLLGAGPLADLLDLPTALLRGAGLVLFPYVAYLVWLSTREKRRIRRSGRWWRRTSPGRPAVSRCCSAGRSSPTGWVSPSSWCRRSPSSSSPICRSWRSAETSRIA